ncbi:MAG TPA: nitroreductase family deazaflavin-dependent oxidoreductase [Candidatus Binatia bacterium]|nr:nitroreductase family deazaflavin-dependent oxidoreductase [Candidatus Binatia bacterium]
MSGSARQRIVAAMNLKDGANIVAHLTTIGRKSGRPRTVELRFLHFKGNFYATSSRVKGKHWCQNLIQNPAVQVSVQGESLSCTAKQLTDDDSRKRILNLRDSPAQLNRVVFEITPQKQC